MSLEELEGYFYTNNALGIAYFQISESVLSEMSGSVSCVQIPSNYCDAEPQNNDFFCRCWYLNCTCILYLRKI
jgi:hypothetical protein